MINIVKFVGKPVNLISNYDNWKKYGFEIDSINYPKLKLTKYGTLSVIGDLPDLSLYEDYFVEAEEKKHPKFGWQYDVTKIYRDVPNNTKNIKRFLQEVLTCDQADALISTYPDIIDRIIQDKDVDLTKLHNIKEKRYVVIKRKVIENFGMIKLVEKFGKYGISFDMLKKIYNDFDGINDIINKLKFKPYETLCNIPQVGFSKADTILLKIPKEEVGWEEDLITSNLRIKACIAHLLRQKMQEGHTKYYIKKIKLEAEKLVPECIDKFEEVIQDEQYIIDDQFIGLLKIYEKEQNIADFCKNSLFNNFLLSENINYEKYRNVNGVSLTDDQLKTLKLINENNITILTAPAGAGKSLSSKAVIDMLKDLGKYFVICSPTGKASKVISEYTNERASTIHKMLGLPFTKREDRYPLPYDVVIIDEFSMADVELVDTLFDSIDYEKTKILIIADNFQLPSVGAGNVLHDMLESNFIPTNRLNKIFRYNEGGLMQVATKIRKSEKYLSDDTRGQHWFGENKDYCFMGLPQTQMISCLKKIYKSYLDSNQSVEDIIILSSFNKGNYGTVKINQEIQTIIHGENAINEKDHVSIGDNIFFLNDLVIQTKNNYKLLKYTEDDFEEEREIAVFNGEVGKIVKLTKVGVVIDYGDNLVFYFKDEMLDLKLAYAISIHRSQGSSFQNVIVLTPKAHTYMLNSNLMYVGCTRARKKVIHLGNSNVINKTIKKKANWDRKTFLKELLK